MAKQIKVTDVVDRMVKATLSRSFATARFTEPDALLMFGFSKGVETALHILFTEADMCEIVKRHPKAPSAHMWLSGEVLEELVSDWRLELVKAGMEAAKETKAQKGAKQGQQGLVDLLTELLKRWEPEGGTKA